MPLLFPYGFLLCNKYVFSQYFTLCNNDVTTLIADNVIPFNPCNVMTLSNILDIVIDLELSILIKMSTNSWKSVILEYSATPSLGCSLAAKAWFGR